MILLERIIAVYKRCPGYTFLLVSVYNILYYMIKLYAALQLLCFFLVCVCLCALVVHTTTFMPSFVCVINNHLYNEHVLDSVEKTSRIGTAA